MVKGTQGGAPPPRPAAVDDGGVEPMDTRPDTVAAAESTLLTNAAQIESTVTQLCEMGFPRDDVVKVFKEKEKREKSFSYADLKRLCALPSTIPTALWSI